MKGKKIVSILAAITLTLGMVACGNSSSKDKEKANETSGDKKVNNYRNISYIKGCFRGSTKGI